MSVKVAASQFKSIKEKKDLNINKAIHIAQQASKEKVNIFLLQELFQTEYFCSTQDTKKRYIKEDKKYVLIHTEFFDHQNF